VVVFFVVYSEKKLYVGRFSNFSISIMCNKKYITLKYHRTKHNNEESINIGSKALSLHKGRVKFQVVCVFLKSVSQRK